MTASTTLGRELRYPDGSARSLLHHHWGHDRIRSCSQRSCWISGGFNGAAEQEDDLSLSKTPAR